MKARPLWQSDALLAIATLGACALCTGPLIAILIGALHAGWSGQGLQLNGNLIRAMLGSAQLLLMGAGVATLLGMASALLVSLCAFPGRKLFAILLAAPLAAPAYVLAYAYGGLMAPGGPLAVLGWDNQARTAFIHALAFYPYVYLATRAALTGRSIAVLEAARSLGAGPWRVLWRVTLPLARPGIAAGAALAAMESLADYGASSYFGASSLATGVFHAWYALSSPGLALQLSAILLLAALALLSLEQRSRTGSLAATGTQRTHALARYALSARAGLAAALACAALIGLAALLPLGWLIRLALLDGSDWGKLIAPLLRSLSLAGLGAGLTLAVSISIAILARKGGAIGRLGARFSLLGYAVPGAVMALGTLAGLGFFRKMGWIGGIGGLASLGILLWAYCARFAATGLGPVAAGLTRISPSQDFAARGLGAGPIRRVLRLDLPMVRPSMAIAALIVFVEILKELPATLILRPLDWDTLAVRAHAYAADERLVQAAAPALLITLAGALSLALAGRVLAAPPQQGPQA